MQCLLASALNVKADIETRRAKNQLGTIVWQFNEVSRQSHRSAALAARRA